MTDGSTGSFATYFSELGSVPESTSTMDVDQPAAVEMETCRHDQEAPLEQKMQEAQWQVTDALDALRQLSEGIRIITRQMKNSHEEFQLQETSEEEKQDGSLECFRARSWSDSCSLQSCTSDDERRLSDLSRQLEGTLGADLMGLSHAAQMLGENSRMVSHEASLLTQDVHLAQETCQEAKKRANKAESAVKILYTKQKRLIGELEKSKKERGVLKRQVVALLKENEDLKKQNEVVRALELHVAGALHAHERQLALKQSKQQDENTEDGSRNVATVRIECPPHDETKAEVTCVEDHFATKDETEEKALSDVETSVKASENNGRKEADNSAVPNGSAQVPVPEKQKRSTGRVGFGGSIGFGGFGMRRSSSWRAAKPKTEKKPSVELEKTVDTESTDDQEIDPALITPTNSDDDPDPLEQPNSSGLKDSGEDSLSSQPKAHLMNQGVSTTEGHQRTRSVSPSPTERSGLVKGFFHIGSKDRASKVVRKPLLQLDEDSLDPTESSNDCPSTSVTSPGSESNFAQNSLPLECNTARRPPRSLAGVKAGHVSPYAFEALQTPSKSMLDDRVFRSLAIPGEIMTSPRRKTPKSISPQSCPPEIAQIYAEMSELHEC